MTTKIGFLDVQNAKVGASIMTNEDFELGGASFKNVEVPILVQKVGKARITNVEIKDDPKIARSTKGGFSGWRLPAVGPPLPSYCSECKRVFASQNYQLTGGYFFLWNNDDNCINCGFEQAKLSEGHFHLARDTIEILRAPDITKAMVKRLQRLGRGVLHGRLEVSRAVSMASSIHPRLGQVVEDYAQPTAYAVGLLLAICGAVITMREFGQLIGVVPDQNITQQMLEEALKRHGELWNREAKKGQNIELQHDEGRTPAKQEAVQGASPIPNEKTSNHTTKKTRRIGAKEHRKAFGGARSR